MELRDRKQIINLPRYADGKEGHSLYWDKVPTIPDIAATSKYILGPANFAGSPTDIQNPNIPRQKIDIQQERNISVGDKALNAAPQILTNALNFTGSVINANTLGRSSADILRDAGTRAVKNGDFYWQKQNEIDSDREMSDLHKQHVTNTISTMGAGAAFGASIGSIFPGAGTAIGAVGGAIIGGIAGLIGGGNTHAKLRKRIYNAQQQRINNNNYNFAAAQGDWLNQQYDLNHDYTQDGQIYVS